MEPPVELEQPVRAVSDAFVERMRRPEAFGIEGGCGVAQDLGDHRPRNRGIPGLGLER
jgi:hypothetical protein